MGSTPTTIVPPLPKKLQPQVQTNVQTSERTAQTASTPSVPSVPSDPPTPQSRLGIELQSDWISAYRELNRAKRELDAIERQKKSAQERVDEARGLVDIARRQFEEWVESHS